ncbi:MAG: hypothetical protein ACKOPD_02285, partial [Polynucleobacter victoriensis]
MKNAVHILHENDSQQVTMFIMWSILIDCTKIDTLKQSTDSIMKKPHQRHQGYAKTPWGIVLLEY